MTNQQKLEALIQKAIDGGWEQQLRENEWHIHESGLVGRYVLCIPRHATKTKTHLDTAAVLFDHDFAKALWPSDGGTKRSTRYDFDGEYWALQYVSIQRHEYHLQQMVIADDPIDYAYKSVFENKADAHL